MIVYECELSARLPVCTDATHVYPAVSLKQ